MTGRVAARATGWSWRPRTLRARMALWYAAFLTAALLAFTVIVYQAATADEDDDDDEAQAARARVVGALAVGLPVAVGIAVAGGVWLLRRGLSPIDEVVRVAGALDVENLAVRIPVAAGAPQEVARLVFTLNEMLARIERSVGGLRRFTADASHELRTPLSATMGELEVTLRRARSEADMRAAMERALEDLGRLQRMVESLLTLARSDAGELPIERVPVDVGALVRRTAEPYEAVAVARGLALALDAPAGLGVAGDTLWLGRAVANLVDNACKFTPRGGRVRVAAEAAGGRVRIVVDDTGAPLGAAERERVFERFYRADAARGTVEGFGLGLPLARDIARALGGDVRAEVRPDGAGNRFVIDLPAASS